MFNFPRPRSFLLALALLLFAEQGFAQCNNLIQNPKIDGTIILSTPRQEFVLGGVPSWNEELKTPQLAGSAKAYSQSTVSFYWGTSSTGEAIGQDIPALQAGEKYAFAMMIKKEPGTGNGKVQAYLTFRHNKQQMQIIGSPSTSTSY